MSKGSLRLLTSDEIALAKSIFRNLVIYSRVWIHHGSYLPFNLQGKNTAMSPNGGIYFKDWYCDDFSGKSFQYQHIFIHEMAHIWQFQSGK